MRPSLSRGRGWLASAAVLLGTATAGAVAAHRATPPGEVATEQYDPLAFARSMQGRIGNDDATIPPQCYASTAGGANGCWVCHTRGHRENMLTGDWSLQTEYTFSGDAQTSYWTNLTVDRRPAMRALSDAAVLYYIRQDNYAPLRRTLAAIPDYRGFRPDLDIARGFDDDGFARDATGWRALRYKPFPGAFWPTNGSAGDVFVRLPASFGNDANGRPSRAISMANFAILEASVAADPQVDDALIDREVGAIDEAAAGIDLDGDGVLGQATRVRSLPKHYAGAASTVPVRRLVLPQGIELLHSVRYVDPDEPDLLAHRMKELRYMRKAEDLDPRAIVRAYEREEDEREEGATPVFQGSALEGVRNDFGWVIQGFIEDASGRLRLQTDEEHRFCMGCHTGVGVTVDATFSLARKVPGRDGWRTQDLRGMRDAPQVGHAEPETLTYLRRLGGADDHRSNDEMTARFLANGLVREAEVRRAAPGGDRDLAHLLAPSRARAVELAKAYVALVRSQSFTRGRDAVVAPTRNAMANVDPHNRTTGLAEVGRVYTDGRLQLAW